MSLRIYLGADHAGFELKEQIKLMLERENFTAYDLGNTEYEQTDDYPDFAKLVAEKAAKSKTARGILCCHSGVGMCIAANKIKGARAIFANNIALAREAVNDNNANILCLGRGYSSIKEAKNIVLIFLKSKFSEAARHKRRLKKIQNLESEIENLKK